MKSRLFSPLSIYLGALALALMGCSFSPTAAPTAASLSQAQPETDTSAQTPAPIIITATPQEILPSLPTATPLVLDSDTDPGAVGAVSALDAGIGGGSDPQTFYVPHCAPNTTWPLYSVQRGDNLSRIARRAGTTAAVLATANCLINPNRIYVGQLLRVPNAPVLPTPIHQPTYGLYGGPNWGFSFSYPIQWVYQPLSGGFQMGGMLTSFAAGQRPPRNQWSPSTIQIEITVHRTEDAPATLQQWVDREVDILRRHGTVILRHDDRLVMGGFAVARIVFIWNGYETHAYYSIFNGRYLQVLIEGALGVGEQMLWTIQPAGPSTEPVGPPRITFFGTPVQELDYTALANRTLHIPVSWATENRLTGSNLVFEQVFTDGTFYNVELPRPNPIVPSNGSGVVRPILPCCSDQVTIRVRLVGANGVLDVKSFNLPIRKTPPTPIWFATAMPGECLSGTAYPAPIGIAVGTQVRVVSQPLETIPLLTSPVNGERITDLMPSEGLVVIGDAYCYRLLYNTKLQSQFRMWRVRSNTRHVEGWVSEFLMRPNGQFGYILEPIGIVPPPPPATMTHTPMPPTPIMTEDPPTPTATPEVGLPVEPTETLTGQ